MKLIVCLDDSLGMAFNNRRQSRDRAVIADVAETTKGQKLYAYAYSEKLLSEGGVECEIIEAGSACDGYLFLETSSPDALISEADGVVIYRWNRRYPADIFFGADLEKEGFKLASSEDIVGYSHEKITKETYVK